jgi:hypothetical protein
MRLVMNLLFFASGTYGLTGLDVEPLPALALCFSVSTLLLMHTGKG